MFGLGHSLLFSRYQSRQCRSRHERQVSSRGVDVDRDTPTCPLALRDDLVSPIVVRVCCCHRRASQEAPVFWRNPACAVRFTSAKKKKPRRASWMWEVYNRQKEAQRLSGGWASPPPRLSGAAKGVKPATYGRGLYDQLSFSISCSKDNAHVLAAGSCGYGSTKVQGRE